MLYLCSVTVISGFVCLVLPTGGPDPFFIVDCDFDEAIGFCHYTNSKNDDFNWYRYSGSTPTDSTGPSGDHTTGSGELGNLMKTSGTEI